MGVVAREEGRPVLFQYKTAERESIWFFADTIEKERLVVHCSLVNLPSCFETYEAEQA